MHFMAVMNMCPVNELLSLSNICVQGQQGLHSKASKYKIDSPYAAILITVIKFYSTCPGAVIYNFLIDVMPACFGILRASESHHN
jgi:hypothetical protein